MLEFWVFMQHQFLVCNGSSRSGKTTTALNLALSFVLMGKPVRLFSLNGNRDLSTVFNSAFYRASLFQFHTIKALSEIQKGEDIVLVDLNFQELRVLASKDLENFKVIIPLENEFYGLEAEQYFTAYCIENKIPIAGFLAVMVRSGAYSKMLLEKHREILGEALFNAYIPRNFYLARQFDKEKFEWEAFTNCAATTYLNFATELIHV